jgi:hypothetical protein
MKLDKRLSLTAHWRTATVTVSAFFVLGAASAGFEAGPRALAYIADLNPPEIEVMVNNATGWAPISIAGSIEQDHTLSIQKWCTGHPGQGGYVKVVTDAEPVTLSCDSQPFFTFHRHDGLSLPAFLQDLLRSPSPPITRPTITSSLSADERNTISSINTDLDSTVDQATIYRMNASHLASAKEIILRGGPGARVFREAAPGVVLVLTNRGRGSGVVLSQQGTILTNWYVIEDAKWIGVFLRPPPGQQLANSGGFESGDSQVSMGERV